MKSSFDWFDLHRNPLASCKMQAISMQGGNASVLLCKAGGAEALGLLSPGQQPLQLRIAHAPSTMAHRPSMDLRMSVRRRDRCRLQPDYLRQQFQMDGVCHAQRNVSDDHLHYRTVGIEAEGRDFFRHAGFTRGRAPFPVLCNLPFCFNLNFHDARRPRLFSFVSDDGSSRRRLRAESRAPDTISPPRLLRKE